MEGEWRPRVDNRSRVTVVHDEQNRVAFLRVSWRSAEQIRSPIVTIAVTCACGKHLRIKDELAGKRVTCPDCGETVLVPPSKDADESALPLEPAAGELRDDKPSSAGTRTLLLLGLIGLAVLVAGTVA